MSGTAGTSPYRIPAALRDLVMLDLLELTGSTTATAELLAMSQPSISRRYRSLARDLGLERQSAAPVGRRFADAPWISDLRRGINRQRLSSGVMRVGSASKLEAEFAGVPWAQWVRLGRQQQLEWHLLLALELLDAIAFTDVPPLSDEQTTSLTLIEFQSERAMTLICRSDPHVLQICNQLNN